MLGGNVHYESYCVNVATVFSHYSLLSRVASYGFFATPVNTHICSIASFSVIQGVLQLMVQTLTVCIKTPKYRNVLKCFVIESLNT